jgi:hypothetical protein
MTKPSAIALKADKDRVGYKWGATDLLEVLGLVYFEYGFFSYE